MLNSISRTAWIVDSGASDHIICNERFFSKSKKLDFPISVQLPNGNATYVTMIGTVILSPLITLQNVFYVPEFHFNLISVSRACKENSCRVLFNHDHCLFQALSIGKLMGSGRISQGLYFWTSFSSNFSSSCIGLNKKSLCNITTNDKLFLDHQRLGHSAAFPYPQCSICPLAKQARMPFVANLVQRPLFH